APQGTERVAEAEVDAAHPPPGEIGRPIVRHAPRLEVGVDQALQRLERALVLLPHPALTQAALLGGDEGGRDPRALLPGDAHAPPARVAAVPLAPEEAAAAE